MGKGRTAREVEAKWIIRLGGETKLLMSEGDEVGEGDVLAVEEKRRVEYFDMTIVMSTMGEGDVEEWRRTWKDKKVKKGDLMMRKKGLFRKKVFFPVDGRCLSVDESFNVCIEVGEKVRREIVSPVTARVEEVSGDKIVLSFVAVEFKGEAMVKGKVWGKSVLTSVSKDTELNSSFEGKIVLSVDPSRAFLVKMEVVGAVGLITRQKKKENFLAGEIPVLSLNEKDWVDLVAEAGEKERRMLLNTKAGRLLLVV